MLGNREISLGFGTFIRDTRMEVCVYEFLYLWSQYVISRLLALNGDEDELCLAECQYYRRKILYVSKSLCRYKM